MRGLLGFIIAAIIVVVIILVVDLDGCGLDGRDGPENDDTLTTPSEQAEAEGRPAEPENQPEELPPRPAGEVAVEGAIDGSLTTFFTEGDGTTPGFAVGAEASGLNIEPVLQQTDEGVGFNDLCDGRVDLVDASRPIAPEEVERCERNGLQAVEFVLGYDAAVLATKNEADVGADCVSISQLREVFEAGSPIEAWNQIEPFFFPVRLDTAGPAEGTSDFNFVFERILGLPNPTQADLREDYEGFAEEDPVRRAVWRNQKGVLGIVGFSFYGLHENQLRPLEIDGETGDSCVFPSEETISALLYPFTKGLRLYTTTRSLQRAEVREFMRAFIERAEDLAVANDFIPLLDTQRQAQLRRLDNPTALAEPTLVDEAGVIIAYRIPQPTEVTEGTEGQTTTETTIGAGTTETTTTVPGPGTEGSIAEQRAPDAAAEDRP